MALKRGDQLDTSVLTDTLKTAREARDVAALALKETPLSTDETAEAQARTAKEFCGLFRESHANALLAAIEAQITRAKRGQLDFQQEKSTTYGSTSIPKDYEIANKFDRLVQQVNAVANITDLIRENNGDLAQIDKDTWSQLAGPFNDGNTFGIGIVVQFPKYINRLVEGLEEVGITPEVIKGSTHLNAAVHALKSVGKTDDLTARYLTQESRATYDKPWADKVAAELRRVPGHERGCWSQRVAPDESPEAGHAR